MKTKIPITIFLLTFLGLTVNVSAQSQKEQLRQMATQLQTTPGDDGLRERIIKFAAAMKPSPVISDEAIGFEGRGQFAFAHAKSVDDYLAAAKEYEKAVAADPWLAPYYKFLSLIYEKAGKLEDARRNCEFYLIGLTDPTQIIEAKRRIAGLEYGIEKANSPESRAAKERDAAEARVSNQKSRDENMMKNLEGATFTWRHPSGNLEEQYRISNGRAEVWSRRLAPGGLICSDYQRSDGPTNEEVRCDDTYTVHFVGRRGETRDGKTTIEIAEDGQTLVERFHNYKNEAVTHVYKRR